MGQTVVSGQASQINGRRQNADFMIAHDCCARLPIGVVQMCITKVAHKSMTFLGVLRSIYKYMICKHKIREVEIYVLSCAVLCGFVKFQQSRAHCAQWSKSGGRINDKT
jgi:hypothetical protein